MGGDLLGGGEGGCLERDAAEVGAAAEVDVGARVGATSEESAELKRLRREVAELRRANEILKAASAFFARELDPRPPRS